MSAAELDRDRLARVLGMLGSDHAGERANAAAAADRLVRGNGLTWSEVLEPQAPPAPPAPATGSVGEMVAFCRRHPAAQSSWERKFVASIAARPYGLSVKQRAVLNRIFVKCRGAGGQPRPRSPKEKT
jgi:hypothetical protein